MNDAPSKNFVIDLKLYSRKTPHNNTFAMGGVSFSADSFVLIALIVMKQALTNKADNMEKQFYAVYLNPSRPDFAMTMTDSERAIMVQHVAYWTEKLKQGKVYAFGPVIDPKEIYGLGVVAVNNEQELKDIIANDPAGKINKYEYFPMRAVVPNISFD